MIEINEETIYPYSNCNRDPNSSFEQRGYGINKQYLIRIVKPFPKLGSGFFSLIQLAIMQFLFVVLVFIFVNEFT